MSDTKNEREKTLTINEIYHSIQGESTWAGKPCVLVDGFRAISLSGAGRSATPGGSRDLTYHVAWERVPNDIPHPALPPIRLDKLQAAAQAALDEADWGKLAHRDQDAVLTRIFALIEPTISRARSRAPTCSSTRRSPKRSAT